MGAGPNELKPWLMNISTGAFTARYVVIPDDQRTGMNLTLADRKRLNQLLEDLAHYLSLIHI